ncbi:hypothetical protein TIFTF001_014735 [Ficus carica]|uniref:PH domain-containing protein n=1 Tax=Ficus carica TaxID=3494 RepID=A0AA88A4G2_FICCA|nr:hypothetical protein TIFTF001_014735 [Ficus carica]
MEITIEEFSKEPNEFIVRVDGRFTVNTTWADSDSDLKRWIQRIQKIYRRSLKDEPYELIQICVERHCVLRALNSMGCLYENWFPKPLKDFLHDNGVTVVGVGIDKLGEKMAKDYGWLMPNRAVELRDLAAELRKGNMQGTANNSSEDGDQTSKIDFRRFGLARLARVVLGEEVNFVKPVKITWCNSNSQWNPYEPVRLTNDMIKYASVEAFLTSYMGTTLLDNRNNH